MLKEAEIEGPHSPFVEPGIEPPMMATFQLMQRSTCLFAPTWRAHPIAGVEHLGNLGL